jgi:hypothetical protein
MPNTFLTVSMIAAAVVSAPFAIEVTDEQTGRGVPLVELTTTAGVTYVTDSAGLVAFDDPALMGQRVYFEVKSHGYEVSKDGFGFSGRAFDVTPGGKATIKLKRLNIAERLYRITGEGIYRDSVLLGREAPIKQPLINSKVTGSDSVMTAIYRGKMHWFWGDTNWPAYPLGLFDTPGATSSLPQSGPLAPRVDDSALDPANGVDLTYFIGTNGFARATAKMPGSGPTWISGLAVLPDASGRERMLCSYSKIKPPMTVYARGFAQWNDDEDIFQLVKEFPADAPIVSEGHPVIVREQGSDYMYFATPYPVVRTKATAEAYLDLKTYEAFTCLKPGSTLANPEIERDEAGRPRYAWKKNAPPLNPQEQAKLIKQGLLKAEDALLQTRDAVTGKPVLLHGGSVYWNAYRQRYVMIAVEIFGTSMLGEVWYAESSSLTGHWPKAVKIVTHDKYSFYNPKHHPQFDQEGGRLIYFEGTYTHTFSGNDHRTPRYDYNQIMYRLDLSHERLKPAQN